jgi:electron transfer flavoprotein alpha subunit
MNDSIESKIWVFAEQRRGHLVEVGIELLGKAVSLAEAVGWKTAGVLIGSDLGSAADELLSYGVDEVITADDPLLADYCNEAYVKALEGVIRESAPEVFLLGATAVGTDFAPRIAARLRTGLSAHCIDLDLTPEGELHCVVPGWGGNVAARITCPKTRPQTATVTPGVFGMPPKRRATGRIIPLNVQIEPEDVTYRIVEEKKEEVAGGGIETADVVVAGGWGVGAKSDWKLIEELAEVLRGAVGATRPPVDEGWAAEDQMIGQSGRTVHPKLYIGVGISGHMHHLVGLKNVDLSIAINSDPDAAIFFNCDLGLTGDFKEIVPELIKAIQAYSTEETQQ